LANPINIFIAYSHKDEAYLNELRAQLKILERRGIVNTWHDGKIIAGQKWDAVIEDKLAHSDIFLMLLSADFINSDYAYGKEMKQALERHERGEATIIPIIARDCAWELTPLAELQAPVQGKALSSVNAEQRQSLYKGIVLAIHKAVQQRQAEIKNQQRYFADEKAWDNALQLNSINAYSRYLEQHPQGGHAEEARQAISKIQQQQAQEKQAIEQKAWQAAQRENTITAYQDYLQKYPNGQYIVNANTAIQFLKQDHKQQAKKTEQTAFQSAKTQHSIAAYRKYLVSYPNGQYQKEALRAIKRLEQSPSPFNARKIGLAILAVLLLGVVVWQGSSLFGSKDTDNSTTNAENTEEIPDESISLIDTITTKDKTPPKPEDKTPVEEEVIIPALKLSQKWGDEEIIITIAGGKAPYTLRLLKGKSEKYSRAYRKAATYRIPVTKAYREAAGKYILILEDNEGGKVSKNLTIDPLPETKPPSPQPSTSASTFKEPSMVKVAGDTFTMGCQEGRDGDCDGDEKPAHPVTLSTYYIGKYEVTNEEFCAFLNEEGNQEEGGTTWLELESKYCKIAKSNGKFVPKSGYVVHPVVEVSWYGARAYCKWISSKTGKSYRLPSEAEWEFAARGGNKSNDYLYAGSNTLSEVAWYSSNSSGNTHPVGRKKANELGIHDMSGNVYEWCADYWHTNYKDAPTNGSAWISGGDNRPRVLRGGSLVNYDIDCRVSSRDGYDQPDRLSIVGYRVSRY